MMKRVMKEVKALHRAIDSAFAGQIRVAEPDNDEDGYFRINVDILPRDGPYALGKFTFKITCQEEYGPSPPSVTCLSTILHPNIMPQSEGGDICVSLLEEWTADCTLEDMVQALIFLLYNPNPESALNYHCSVENVEDMAALAKRSLFGGSVETGTGESIELPVNLNNPFTFEPLTEREIEAYKAGELVLVQDGLEMIVKAPAAGDLALKEVDTRPEAPEEPQPQAVISPIPIEPVAKSVSRTVSRQASEETRPQQQQQQLKPRQPSNTWLDLAIDFVKCTLSAAQ